MNNNNNNNNFDICFYSNEISDKNMKNNSYIKMNDNKMSPRHLVNCHTEEKSSMV